MKKAAVPSILVVVVLLAVASHSRGAAAEESPADRVSIEYRSSYVSPPVPRQFGWLCASVAT